MTFVPGSASALSRSAAARQDVEGLLHAGEAAPQPRRHGAEAGDAGTHHRFIAVGSDALKDVVGRGVHGYVAQIDHGHIPSRRQRGFDSGCRRAVAVLPYRCVARHGEVQRQYGLALHIHSTGGDVQRQHPPGLHPGSGHHAALRPDPARLPGQQLRVAGTHADGVKNTLFFHDGTPYGTNSRLSKQGSYFPCSIRYSFAIYSRVKISSGVPMRSIRSPATHTTVSEMRCGQLQLVEGQQHRQIVLPHHALEHRQKLQLVADVQKAGGLVQHDDLRLLTQRPRQEDALALPVADGGEGAVGKRHAAYLLQGALHDGLVLRLRMPSWPV